MKDWMTSNSRRGMSMKIQRRETHEDAANGNMVINFGQASKMTMTYDSSDVTTRISEAASDRRPVNRDVQSSH